MIVAIDGPAGAGKSTVAKAVAQELGFTLVDTGAIYRAVALLASRNGVAFDDDDGLAKLLELDISFRFVDGLNHVYLDGEDITEAIRTNEMSMGASAVSSRKVVRDGLLRLQRDLAGKENAVLEGRDIGTVVCPDARVKFYLDAAPEERARRRFEELTERGDTEANYESVLAEVRKRDAQDMGRQHAPLKPAADATILDSTKMDTPEVVSTIIRAAREHL